VVLRGPFYVQVKQFCVQRPQLSQETVLVDICDTDGDKYRFGFNGKEKINEWAGIGNHLDFGSRVHDSRVARLNMSVDPLAPDFPWQSPYVYAADNPIVFNDRDGEKKYHYSRVVDEKTGTTTLKLNSVETVYKTVQDGWIYNSKANGWGRYPNYKTIEDTKDQFIVHQKDHVWIDNGAGNRKHEYDETVTFNSLKEAENVSDEDFRGTSEDRVAAFLVGLGGVASEHRQGRTFGRGYNRSSGLSQRKPSEPYNRVKHYGRTPTKGDRNALEAKANEVVDHKVTLVQHYYEGDGKGGKPGFLMTQEERVNFGKDRSNMQLQPKDQSNSQGGQMSHYSKQKKKEHFGNSPYKGK
jgi:hypothetical protein